MWLVNKSICLLLLVFISLSALAQSTDSSYYQRIKPYPYFKAKDGLGSGLRFAPLQLINFVPAFQLGIEYPIADNVYLQNEFGWVFPGHMQIDWYETPNFQQIRGLKSRFEIKFFVHPVSPFYLSVEFIQNHLKYDRERTFAVNVTGIPGVDFYQIQRYTLTKNVWGSHFKVGWELPLDDRLFVDLFMGIGLRKVYVTNDLPDYLQNEVPRNQGFFWDIINIGEELRPSAALGFALIYRIKRG